MQLNHRKESRLINRRERTVEGRAARVTYSTDSITKKIEAIQAKATSGDYQSQLRLEAINQLLNPCLEFSESDVQKIINKGYPLQVERGLKLYRLMSRLTILCEPVGDTIGVACRVRLVNFEDLTFSELLDLKNHISPLLSRISDKGMTSEQFNGLELLNSEDKDLYKRAKQYFGGRKRPTLKSLALDLLSEVDEGFTDRSAFNYLAAVRDFRNKHKDKLGIGWYFFGGVDSFNKNPKSARGFYTECAASVSKVVRESIIPIHLNIREMAFGMNEQMLRVQQWSYGLAAALPKVREQVEAARKLAASAVFGVMRMPQMPLPKVYFRDDFM